MPNAVSRPRGPRGADANTREDIKAAALELFAERGYEATSLRAIAKHADVDPALIRHYFESKSELFVASMGPLDKIVEATDVIIGPGPDGAGERLVRTFLGVWGSDEYGPRLKAILRTVLVNPEIATVAKRLVFERLFTVIARELSPDNHDARASAVASQMIGLGVGRYILELGPIASMSDDEVVAQIAPTIQRYLVGTSP